MLVDHKNTKFCCGFCHSDFGHSSNARRKTKHRRQLKAQERRQWKKEISE